VFVFVRRAGGLFEQSGAHADAISAVPPWTPPWLARGVVMPSLADSARAAFASGWAASGGPLTERVKAAATVAQHLALAHAGGPGVLEATIQLGALEGMWAAIYARRDVLYARHDKAVRAAWHDYLSAELDVPTLVAAVRRAVGLTEATSDDTQQHRDREASVIAIVLAALTTLFGRARGPKYQALLDAIERAVRDGVAEGTAGGIAIAAQQAGFTAIDFDAAFRDAATAAGSDQQYQGHALEWLGQMVGAVSRDLGRRLHRMATEDATSTQMATETRSSGTGRHVAAVALLTDWALGHAFTLGALAVYGLLAVATVEWVTVGGAKVCSACLSLESGGPYAVFGAPQPPRHPSCRCVLVPAGPIASLRMFGQYLIGG